MAWEDRTKAEKKRAKREAKEYARTDDDATYVVTDGNARYTVKGINSARAVAGKTGKIAKK